MILFRVNDEGIVSFPWEDVLPEGVTLSSVVHSIDSPMTKVSESNTTTTSSVKIKDAAHASRFMVGGLATLSNGEVLSRKFPVLGWFE